MQLTIDGTRFDVLDEGSGPAIVLVHGFPLSKETWDPHVPALARRARVVRFDVRGLGRSEVTAGPYLMESLASDVAGVLDALRIERAAIVGHSLGAYIAFAFYRLFAERCLGLAIVGGRATGDDAAAAAARRVLAARAEAEGMGPVSDAFLPRYFAPGFAAAHPDIVAALRETIARTDPRAAAALLRGMADRASCEDLFAEIDVPFAAIAGAEDAIIPRADVLRMTDGIRGAELTLLPCGHFPSYEQPERFAEALARFAGRALGMQPPAAARGEG